MHQVGNTVAAAAPPVAGVSYLNFTVSKSPARVFRPEHPASRTFSVSVATQNVFDLYAYPFL